MNAVDVHQHLWPEPVLQLLEGRADGPRARWRDGGWDVDLVGEPCFRVDPVVHDPERRAAAVRAAGLDRALVALSSPAGLESLPGDDGARAVAAWTKAAAALPSELGWWAAVPLDAEAEQQRALLRLALDAGAAGLCVPAGSLATPERAERMLPILTRLAVHGAPLFVHPGPAQGSPQEPAWWSPSTRYVSELHAAWHAFHAVVRPQLPSLRVLFALLAGLAPLHVERTDSRGGALEDALDDARCFYDTSSYGARAVSAMARAVGSAQLVHGSDHPVAALDVQDGVTAALGEDAADRARRAAPARLLGTAWFPA